MDAKAILRVKGNSIFYVKPDSAISEAVRIMHDNKVGSVLVMESEEDRLLGILTERDIIRVVAEQSCTALQGVVADAMSRDIMACTADCTINAIISGMGKSNLRHLPVFEDDKLRGVISARDVMHFRIQQLETGAEPRFQRLFSKGKVYPLGS